MHRHAEDDGVKIIAEEGHEGGIRCLEVMSQTRTLLAGKRELYGAALIERLAEVEELLGGNSHHTVRAISRLDITVAKSLLVIHNEGQETREIAVLDTRHQRFVLAERTREQHAQLRCSRGYA